MDFLEYMLWKLGALAVIAFLLGFFNLLPGQGRRDKQAGGQDRKED